MKLLTFAVPCYNSEAYMEKCVESLLVGGEEVEILIVDDGSKDGTAEIADRLEAEHPTIVRAIHQPNKGHGGAVNTGIENATGLYFKVVDSDDKLRASALGAVLDTLRGFVDDAGEASLDLLVSNFVYDKEGQKHKRVMEYRNTLPTGRVFTWEEAGKFRKGHYILMHSVIYRTEMLKASGMVLPKHTFYVDNIFVFYPLPFVKKLYYIDADFYHYFIGREDQSVQEAVMMKRIDQQLRVNRIMIDTMAGKKIENPKVWEYMRNYLDIICTISSILLIRIGTKDALQKKDELWDYLKNADAALYKSIRGGFLGRGVNLPGSVGRKLAVVVYRIAQKVYGFN